ncbi:hypothetical protein APHAL10511_001904 [Amanita phalloides]|nr:hypothetical protein APHAL10511_001904 [Amanita phalloides]
MTAGGLTLAPPPLARSRASSTTLRSGLTLTSLGRRRSTSCLNPPPPSPLDPMSVLPLSASAHKSSFAHDVHDSVFSSSRLVLLLFFASTALVLVSMYTLPITLAWPRTITDIARLGRELHAYSQSGVGPLAHVLAVMAVSAVWKHAWSIPGSVVWNVLAGALFSPALATLLLTLLTTIGSVCATLLATPLAPFLAQFFPKALDMTRAALEGEAEADLHTFGTKTKSSAWVRLSILRLIGVIPWSGINIACGVCGVAISDCFLGSFIGSLPWTAVTCQIGDILQTVASTPSSPTSQSISSLLTSPDILLKLVFLSFLSLAPILSRNRLRAFISNSAIIQEVERPSRWDWVRAWRYNLRSRLARQPPAEKDLPVLVQEKMALQGLPS